MAPMTWEFGGAVFDLLAPRGGMDSTVATNDTSTVMRVSFAGHSVLLTGDIEDQAQTELLKRGDLSADVLVLPHHGSVRASSREFLKAVGPRLTIRSSGQKAVDTFSGLSEILGQTRLLNTADVGAVTVIIDRNGLRVMTARPPRGRPPGR